jgi:hypothetical protein
VAGPEVCQRFRADARSIDIDVWTVLNMPRRLLPLLLLSLTAQAWQADLPREASPSEYLVAGTVVWAHAGASSIAIRGSGLLGYLRIRVRSYRVKQASALLGLRPGDAVTAVFSRRDGMLHRLRRLRSSMADPHQGDTH